MKKTSPILCICRYCEKEYNALTSRADHEGYCSAKCECAKAKSLGYSKTKETSWVGSKNPHTEYGVLRKAKALGRVLSKAKEKAEVVVEFKPCPFCGNEPEVTNDATSKLSTARCSFKIACVNYDACKVLPSASVSWTRSGGRPEGEIEKTIDAWNTRPGA